jgi:NAD(P)-dependent dehydrogenase (short-subunit alcohol dehydrogenase family)
MSAAVVIVTGASGGLGAAAARSSAKLGARVTLAARSLDRLREQARNIEQAGGKALVVGADVSRAQDCRAIIDQTLAHFGRIDALVNNAGTIEPMGPIAQARPDEWERNWAVNVLGPVMLVQMALPHLRESRGRVVNITSGASLNVVGGWGAYSAAKAALNHLTRILAGEESAVTAVAFHPGIMDTAMQAHIRETGKSRMAERNYQWLSSLHEEGRLVPPEESGAAVACLALHAPQEWSGELIQWDEPRVRELVQEVLSEK